MLFKTSLENAREKSFWQGCAQANARRGAEELQKKKARPGPPISTALTKMALSASISAATYNYEHIARIPGRTAQPERFGAFDRADNPREPRARGLFA